MGSADQSHPSTEELERFMRGELKRSEVRGLVRHLLTGCPRCVAVTRRLWSFGDRSLHVLEAVSAAAGARERGVERMRRKARVFSSNPDLAAAASYRPPRKED